MPMINTKNMAFYGTQSPRYKVYIALTSILTDICLDNKKTAILR